ncbi:MAG: polysaccharide biosynthesis/export protein [Thermotogaceae bacterium]|nr:polysaccharide biosynthesis/export protein [Thermotogaceae bacterium]
MLKKIFLVFLIVIFSITLYANSERYRIQIGDVLEIYNYGYSDLSQTVTVGPDGIVELRLVGPKSALGKTPEEFASLIEGDYKKHANESRINVIVKSRTPKFVYVMGEVVSPQNVNIVLREDITLLEILSLCGGPTEVAELTELKLMRNGLTKTIDISPAFNGLEWSERVFLEPDDMIIIPKKYNRRVYLFGNTGKSGPVYFEQKEPMTLNYLLSKMGFNSDVMLPEIKIHRDDRILQFDALYVFNNLEQIKLETNDIVVINKVDERFCYVTGRADGGKIIFDKEEKMSLRTLMGKLSVDMKYLPTLTILHADGTIDSFDSKRLETFDFELKNGDIIQFPISKRVYLIGNAPQKGEIVFSNHEELTLRALLIKIGYQLEEPVEISILGPDGEERVVSTENLMKRDVSFQSGSIIEFPEQRYVNIVGDISSESDRFMFRYDEPMTLKTVIQRFNAIPIETGISVTILRGLEQYQYDTKEVFYSEKKIELLKGDTLVFEKDRERYVLLLKEDNKLSKIYFKANEEMDLFQLFIKLGTISEIWNDEVRVMLPNGDIRITNIDDVLSQKANMQLEPKSMVMLPETYRSVYCFGNTGVQGEIFFKRNEPFTMRQLIIKTNANITKSTEDIIVKTNKETKRYNPEEFMDIEMDVSLEPDSIILFKPFIPKRVSIFGEVEQPGVKVFEQDEPLNLMMLLTKAEGFKYNADRNISIIDSSGNKKVVDFENLSDPTSVELSDRSYVIVDENLDQYVLLLGDVRSPGVKFMKLKEMSLLQLLSQAGGVLDWDKNTRIEITRSNGKKEIIDTDKEPVNLNDITVKVGDIVYVVPSNRLKIYVFGEVLAPRILRYYEGLTLFEALLQCGGPKDSAYLTKILYYKGGIDNYPQVVDLSNIKWSEPTEQVYLQPGDVIYVPKSALVDILRVTGFIGSMITFSSASLDVYNTMTQSDVQFPVDYYSDDSGSNDQTDSSNQNQ